ncbi:hypothetical protein SAMN06296241_0966 [Salinimicrobium sediminis]|uniref:EpsG family protein n=1 Tax=Salinimicrobium sediminis TaxID=1343891 RepID=A0A285X2A9_9FLAO|nr:DUF6427 family protein [Salinimicrobium sediminis]SOC79442.1 hypothetical protein SAMN06296241_0966 [Salinimicrobium sediminis]
MLTSFFSNSRPINFIIVAAYILFFYLAANFNIFLSGSFWTILKESGVLLIIVLSVFLLNFISGRNELTGRNAYKSILFAGFICMLAPALQNNNVILANLFLLLSLRRILSLRSQKETVQKIFDATLWVGVASLFHFWSILFLFVVYFGVLVHVGHWFKNWLVPLVAILTLFSIATSADLLLTDSFYTFADWFQASNFDFTAYREPALLIPTAFIFALSLWSSFFYVTIIQKANANAKSSLFLMLLCALTAVVVAVLSPTKNGSELLFFFAPLAIIVTNYFQSMDDKWFKETLFILILLLPVLLLAVF